MWFSIFFKVGLVKSWMTELLLEITNLEMHSIAKEVYQHERGKIKSENPNEWVRFVKIVILNKPKKISRQKKSSRRRKSRWTSRTEKIRTRRRPRAIRKTKRQRNATSKKRTPSFCASEDWKSSKNTKLVFKLKSKKSSKNSAHQVTRPTATITTTLAKKSHGQDRDRVEMVVVVTSRRRQRRHRRGEDRLRPNDDDRLGVDREAEIVADRQYRLADTIEDRELGKQSFVWSQVRHWFKKNNKLQKFTTTTKIC